MTDATVPSLNQKLVSVNAMMFCVDDFTVRSCVHGFGSVGISVDASGGIVFAERGRWGLDHKSLGFTNVFRWFFDAAEKTLSLEHLRFGIDRPVKLACFVEKSVDHWAGLTSHVCGNDSYSATLTWNSGGMVLQWTVKGPEKNYQKTVTYTTRRWGGL